MSPVFIGGWAHYRAIAFSSKQGGRPLKIYLEEIEEAFEVLGEEGRTTALIQG